MSMNIPLPGTTLPPQQRRHRVAGFYSACPPMSTR